MKVNFPLIKKIGKRIGIILLWIPVWLVGLIILIALLIQLPYIQTKIVQQGTVFLEKKLKTKVQIGHVNIGFPKLASIERIFLADQRGDTLAYIGDINVQVGLFALGQKQISVASIGIENSFIRLYKGVDSTRFNYAFIPEAFASKDTTAKDTSGSPWSFDLKNIALNNVRFLMSDANTKMSVFANIHDFEVDFNTLGLAEKAITIKQIRTKDLIVRLQLPDADTTKIIPIKEPKAATEAFLNSTGFAFLIDEIDFENLKIDYNNGFLAAKKAGIDFNHLAIEKLNLKAKDVAFVKNRLYADINQFSLDEKRSGFVLNDLALFARLDMPKINAGILKLKTPNTSLSDSLFVGIIDIKDTTFISKMSARLNFADKDTIGLNDALFFAPDLATKFPIKNLKLATNGRLGWQNGSLKADKFGIGANPQNQLLLTALVNQALTPNKARADINLHELRLQSAFIARFLPKNTLPAFAKAGKLRLEAKIKGAMHDFKGNAKLNSDFGAVNARFALQTDNKFADKKFDLKANIDKLAMQKILGPGPGVGIVSADINANGRQKGGQFFIPQMVLLVREATFKGYRYTNLRANGQFMGKNGFVKANYNDRNLKFALLADAKQIDNPYPIFNISLDLPRADLKKLKLSTSPMRIQTNLKAYAKGTDPDKMSARLDAYKTKITRNGPPIALDSLAVRLGFDKSGGRVLSLRTDFMQANMQGRYTFKALPIAINQFAKHYFSPYDAPYNAGLKQAQQFSIFVKIKEKPVLLMSFVDGLDIGRPIIFKADFNTKGYLLNAMLDAPSLRLKEQIISGLTFTAKTAANRDLKLNLGATTVQASDSFIIQEPRIAATLKPDDLTFGLKISADDADSRLDLNGRLLFKKDTFKLAILPSLILIKKEAWNITERAAIVSAPNYLKIQNFELAHTNQRIKIFTTPAAKRTSDLHVELGNIEIKEIMDLLPKQGFMAAGLLNGNVLVRNVMKAAALETDIKIDNLALNENILGDFTVLAKRQSNQLIQVNAKLIGVSNNLKLTGHYNPTDSLNALNLDLKTEKLRLEQFAPLAQAAIVQMSGNLLAQLAIRGSISKPRLNGYLLFDGKNVIEPKASRVPLTLIDQKILFKQDKLVLNNFEIKDDRSRNLNFDGQVLFADLTHPELQLQIKSDKFHFLNTNKADSETLYGDLFASVNVGLSGPVSKLVTNGSVRTFKGTQIFLPLSKKTQEIEREKFIRFIKEDSVQLVLNKQAKANEKAQSEGGMDLTLRVNITPETNLVILIDPKTGDQMQVAGQASLMIRMTPQGDLTIQGRYEIEKGFYAMNLFGVVGRRFEIQKGGTLDFTGVPTEATASITAIYTANVARYDLIADQEDALTDNELAAARRRMPVFVYLKMNGQLLKPTIGFDIEVPEDKGGSAIALVSQRIAQIKTDETQLNTQVFGLVALNRFITPTSTTPDGPNAVTSKVNQSVGQFLSGQISNLTEEYLGGLEVNVDLSQNQTAGQSANSTTDKSVGVSVTKSLFDERLKVSLGSNINLNNQAQSNMAALSDITVEYRLNKRGNLSLRFFRRMDQNLYYAQNFERIGVTIAHRQNFNYIKELFYNRKKRKRKQAEKQKALKESGEKKEEE